MRNLAPWNPYQELTNWHRDIDELFRRFLGGASEEAPSGLTGSWMPSMEAFERDGHYIIRADLPGVDPKEVELTYANDRLTLRGERKRSHETNEKGYHYSETAFGRFERTLALPKGVEPDKITAKFENGVVEISLPMPQSSTARKVPIEATGEAPKQIKAA